MLMDLVGKVAQFRRNPMAELCCSVNFESGIEKATVTMPIISIETHSLLQCPSKPYLKTSTWPCLLKVSTMILFIIVWSKPRTHQPLVDIPDLNSSTHSRSNGRAQWYSSQWHSWAKGTSRCEQVPREWSGRN